MSAPGPDDSTSSGPSPVALFLTPEAVPRRKNQLLAVGLAAVAVIVLAVMVTLMLLIRYDNLPSLFSFFP